MTQLEEFYQDNYSQGFTTEIPDIETLQMLKQTNFQHTEKDYSSYLDVIHACGIRPGQIILDFGSSWGYGSWQMRQAGYQVYSSEISRPRADFAKKHLDCEIVGDLSELHGQVDCFFSAHVIEHLADPKQLCRSAMQCLKPTGIMLLFTPNGAPEREKIAPESYHQLWGQVHGLLFSPASFAYLGDLIGCKSRTYTTPYQLDEIEQFTSASNSVGEELLFVAKR